MLIRTSGPITDELYLMTLGQSCHYLLAGREGVLLVNPGGSAHLPGLLARLGEAEVSLREVRAIAATSLDAHCVGAAPLLMELCPTAVFSVSAAQSRCLADPSFVERLYRQDLQLCTMMPAHEGSTCLPLAAYHEFLKRHQTLSETETLQPIGPCTLRVLSAPGHTAESIALHHPHAGILIGDETCGYYNGRFPAAPGGDWDLSAAAEAAARADDLEADVLALPFHGALSGSLVHKHLQAVARNTRELLQEAEAAAKDGVPLPQVISSMREYFFSFTAADPVLGGSIARTVSAIEQQIKKAHYPCE